jgi:hypothetical protein
MHDQIRKACRKRTVRLSVTLVIYGDEEHYYYFAGQGHHVSPFYPSALCRHRYPRANNLIAQSSGEPVTSGGSEGKVGSFADGGRAIGCKLFKTIQAKLLLVNAAAEAPSVIRLSISRKRPFLKLFATNLAQANV